MPGYDLILFDADGTLFDFHTGERNALKESFQEFGLPYDEPTHLPLYQRINLEIWAEFEQYRIAASGLSRERFRRYLEALRLEFDPGIFSDAYLERLSQSTHTMEHAPDVVQALAADFKLVIVTNGLSTVQHPRFKRSDLYPYFSAIVVSEDLGIAKPDPRIFEYAFHSVGHSRKETALMVGDNLASDIRGGENFGIDTCWFNPSKLAGNGEVKPTYEIQTLKELMPVLYE